MLSNGYINCEFDSGNRLISVGTSSWKWFATLGDDPMDSNNIDRGISFYNKLH